MKRLSCAVLLVLAALSARGQSVLTVSPVASFDFGRPLFINRAQGVLDPFSGTAIGNSSSESYGVGADFSLPHLLGPIGLLARAEGVYTSGYFPFSAPNSPTYTVSGIDRKLLFELSALWNPKPLEIRLGPWVSYSLSRNISELNPFNVDITPSNAGSNLTHAGISAGLAWRISNFPVQPEFNSHIDLTEVKDAGSNAFSIGISLSYKFGESEKINPKISSDSSPPSSLSPQPSSFQNRVQFFANGSKLNGPIPLERQELHVTQYAFGDSNGAVHRHESQWIEESYHLPDITVRCGPNGSLRLSNDSRLFAEVPTGASDTTIHLGDLTEWNGELARMNIDSTNRIVANFESASGKSVIALWRDTLVLPPVDTAHHAVPTIIKKEFRFQLSDRFEQSPEGRSQIDSLLHAARELPASTVALYSDPNDASAEHTAIVKRIHDILPAAIAAIPDASLKNETLLVIQEDN